MSTISMTYPSTSPASSSVDDAALVEGCRADDREAMELLYHRYKRRVFGLTRRIVGPGDAEEVTQDAFVRIYKGIGKFRGEAQLSTWIYRLAVNTALSHIKKRSRMVVADDALERLPAAETPLPDPALATRLEHALMQLPEGYRAVIVLHDIEGLNHAQCAKILGCRVGTSKSQLHKARARMRQLLGKSVR